MLDLLEFVDGWLMIGGAALLLLIFVSVFVWNSPRSRQINAPSAPITSRRETG